MRARWHDGSWPYGNDMRKRTHLTARSWCHNRGSRIGLSVAAAAVCLGLNAHGQSLNVPESDDAYHFADWLGTGHLGAYTEWWYFNVFDTANNVQAIFSYLITNPADLKGGVFRLGIA